MTSLGATQAAATKVWVGSTLRDLVQRDAPKADELMEEVFDVFEAFEGALADRQPEIAMSAAHAEALV